MKKLSSKVYIALLHYPVLNKKGDIVVSAVTNLDLHDIARAAKTYGVENYYVVTPSIDQKVLVDDIKSHWTEGKGGTLNPKRKEALELIKVETSLEKVIDDITASSSKPKVVVTTAKKINGSLSIKELKEKLIDDMPFLILFGTGWGLSAEIMEKADYIMEPLNGATDYNHLSVRSAASIIFDRLLG